LSWTITIIKFKSINLLIITRIINTIKTIIRDFNKLLVKAKKKFCLIEVTIDKKIQNQ